MILIFAVCINILLVFSVSKMDVSESFSSLLALVDSHLSKTNLQLNSPTTTTSLSTLKDSSIQLPTPSQRFIIPVLNPNKGPISNNILAEQVANTLKAREAQSQLQKEKHEAEQLEDKMKNVDISENEGEYMIDLTSAITDVDNINKPLSKAEPKKEELTKSLEDLFKVNFKDCDIVENVKPRLGPQLPCKTDFSDILLVKIHRKRVSNFGKVLCSRYKPYAAPYIKERIFSNVKRFDFSIPSPDDLIKEKMKKPQGVDIIAYYGLEVSESLQRTMDSDNK